MNIGPVGVQRTIAERQRALMQWYRRHGRHQLPWRHTRDPYSILVSEVMLQQTQVDRVIPYWTAWVRRWPTFRALARARRADVIRAWAGLGYNRRAVHLHEHAQQVTTNPARRSLFAFSHEKAKGVSGWARGLQRLPGVGPYTANALLAFAWNLPAPCVDTNVRRVLAYAIYRRPVIMRMPLAPVMRLAQRVIPSGRGRDWHYALMDYGALVLTARRISKHPWCPTSDVGHIGRKRNVEKFEGSNRFWRGRIIAVLRDAHRPKSSAAMREELSAYGAPPILAPLLAALLEDRLVRRAGRGFAIG